MQEHIHCINAADNTEEDIFYICSVYYSLILFGIILLPLSSTRPYFNVFWKNVVNMIMMISFYNNAHMFYYNKNEINYENSGILQYLDHNKRICIDLYQYQRKRQLWIICDIDQNITDKQWWIVTVMKCNPESPLWQRCSQTQRTLSITGGRPRPQFSLMHRIHTAGSKSSFSKIHISCQLHLNS